MEAKYFLLLFLGILLETTKNVLCTKFSKNSINSDTDIYKFNVFSYIGSFFIAIFFGRGAFSVFTLVTAIIFALVLNLNQVFFLKALSHGTVSATNFIQSSGLVISTVGGAIICKEYIKPYNAIVLALLLFALFLALEVKKGNLNKQWLLFAFLAMLFMGIIGIMQTYHQSSEHKDELITFLRIAFLCSALMNIPLWKVSARKEKETFKAKSKETVLAFVSGAFIGVTHIINLFLSSVMPKIVFFPLVNGGLVFVTLLAGVIFFKERFSKTQIIGIILGILALSVIGL